MYKGQFAKWRWTKYNKSGKHCSIKPAKSRASRRKKGSRVKSVTPERRVCMSGQPATSALQLAPLSQHLYLPYFGDEDCQVESTLSAYAALILHWSERETPWRTSGPGDLFGPHRNSMSVLQHVRAAQDHFVHGRAQLGGALLRRAFLGIEAAVEGGLDVEALWDCCLAVPQLVLTMGWTDMLSIFARYLYQLTSIKLPGHPITKIAASLHCLSRQATAISSDSPTSSSSASRSTPRTTPWQLLDLFITRAWALWIDCVSRVRGDHDDVTIHLKRGYVTLVDPEHAMARDLLRDFGAAVRVSMARRGVFATTSRILQLEHLLVRMFLPLFTARTAGKAEEMLTAVAARIEGKSANIGVSVAEWDYMDRYLVFSANYFRAAIAAYSGESEKAAWYRHRCLDSPRDLFWLQTSLLLESRLRSDGLDAEANEIQEARVEVQSRLGIAESELRLTGRREDGERG